MVSQKWDVEAKNTPQILLPWYVRKEYGIPHSRFLHWVYVEIIIFWMGWIRYICELHLFLFTFFNVTRRRCAIASVAHIWFLLNLHVLDLLLICWAFSHTVYPVLGLISPLLTLHPPGLCVVASPYPSLRLPLFTGQTRSSGSQCCLFCSWV